MSWNTALHSVSYSGNWGQAKLSLDGFLNKAQALGYDAVMLMAKRPHLSPLDANEQTLQKLQDQLSELRLRVACIAGYNDFGRTSDPVGTPFGEMQLLNVCALCRIAQALQSPYVRLFTGFVPSGAAPDDAWKSCVQGLHSSAQIAADYGVCIGIQNHHDVAAHSASLLDLLEEVDHPNCKLMFDAWAAALHGDDIAAAARRMAAHMVHTTVADYVRRPQFHYDAALVNYVSMPAQVRAVPMGEGFIDYAGFFQALREAGYSGSVAYEICSPIRGGGTEANLDRAARTFLRVIREH